MDGNLIATSRQAYRLEPSTALTQSSYNEGSSSLCGATSLMYSISTIFSCCWTQDAVRYQPEKDQMIYVKDQRHLINIYLAILSLIHYSITTSHFTTNERLMFNHIHQLILITQVNYLSMLEKKSIPLKCP